MPHTNNKNKREEKDGGDKQARGGAASRGDKPDFIRKAFGEKKGGKGNLRKSKEQRKKGQKTWKNVHTEIEGLDTRIAAETPPSGVLYYKY